MSSREPQRRDHTVRLPREIAERVAEGHPWVFDEFLRGRRLDAPPGTPFTLVDAMGNFVARALFDPSGPLVLRVFSREPEARLDAAGVQRVIDQAAAWRRCALDVNPRSALRVLNGDSEGLPAINVDRYGSYLVVTSYSIVAERYEPLLWAALQRCWEPAAIYLQRRYQPIPAGAARPGAELVWGDAAPPEVVVEEGRGRFAVDVGAPRSTGLFIDMRGGREAVARLAAGRRVINCFSYTGAFSVVAALHGARSVLSVDSAPRAHAGARRNLALNGVDSSAPPYEFVTGDTFATLARCAARKRSFDLVIVDPPTFSTAKGRAFTAYKDYAELAAAAVGVIESGGLLLAACNATKLSIEELERALGWGAHEAGRKLIIVERLGQPADYPVLSGFPEGRYLKLVLARVV
ncbi:MAG: class I SAM-dependent rRNA methyltransferase [Proteobacteria bacterium]|nr:class I SAM-dependent rRNA methyltransferase [Pseudomonadota bacterium]